MIEVYDPKRTVRVYVFSFRRNEAMFPDKLKSLPCSFGGVYRKILYFGQIADALQSIVQVPVT